MLCDYCDAVQNCAVQCCVAFRDLLGIRPTELHDVNHSLGSTRECHCGSCGGDYNQGLEVDKHRPAGRCRCLRLAPRSQVGLLSRQENFDDSPLVSAAASIGSALLGSAMGMAAALTTSPFIALGFGAGLLAGFVATAAMPLGRDEGPVSEVAPAQACSTPMSTTASAWLPVAAVDGHETCDGTVETAAAVMGDDEVGVGGVMGNGNGSLALMGPWSGAMMEVEADVPCPPPTRVQATVPSPCQRRQNGVAEDGWDDWLLS